jgi:VanZ family protein
MSDIKPKSNYAGYLKTLPAVIIGIIIFYFSSLSNPYPTPVPEGFALNLNPVMHMGEFGLLSFLIFFGFFSKVKPIYLLTISFFYAFLDEIHQYFVPNRYFDIFDLILDSIGVIIGFISYLLVKKLNIIFKTKYKNNAE